MIGIYIITNKINNKFYIGQSNDIFRRFMEHKNLNKKGCRLLHAAIKKYGVENFKFEILEECTIENLDRKEIFYIEKLQPEYNISLGGQGAKGHSVSEDVRKILSEKSKEQWDNLSEEGKRKRIINNLKGPAKGHSVSEETRIKLRLVSLGKIQSQETIERRKKTMQEKKKTGWRKNGDYAKKRIYCLTTNQSFESLKQAGIELGLNPSSISGVLKGRYKTTKGYVFKYEGVEATCDECNRVGRKDELPSEVRDTQKV